MANFDRKFSNALQSFSNNPAVANLLQVFAEWVEQTDGKHYLTYYINYGLITVETGEPVEGCAPTATVYPNYAKENYPMIPNYVGWTLEPLQGLVRGYVRGVFGMLFRLCCGLSILRTCLSVSRCMLQGYVDRNQGRPPEVYRPEAHSPDPS